MSGALAPKVELWREAVAEADRLFNFGDTISLAWLETAFGIEWPDVATRKQIDRIKLELFSMFDRFREDMLVRHKKALQSIGHGNYRVVEPRDQALYALEETVRGIDRAIRKGESIIDNTRTDLLSPDEMRLHREAGNKLSGMRSLSERQLLSLPSEKEGN